MKTFLGIHETIPVLERLFIAATKFKSELLTDIEMKSTSPMEFLFLARDIHIKTREALQKIDLDMQQFLGNDKVLRFIQS